MRSCVNPNQRPINALPLWTQCTLNARPEELRTPQWVHKQVTWLQYEPIELYCQAEQSEVIGKTINAKVASSITVSHCHHIWFYIWELFNHWCQLFEMKESGTEPLSSINATEDQRPNTWTFSIMETGGAGGWWVTGQRLWSPWGSVGNRSMESHHSSRTDPCP